MKKFSLFFIAIFVVALALTACSSGADNEAAEAPAEPKPTAVSNVPDQPEESKSNDEAMAEESEPEAPPEVEVDTSKDLFDSAAMMEDMGAYVLRPEDMPNQYKIPSNGEQHMTNLKVINSVGEVVGKRYLAATGRIDGWSLELERVNKEELIPYKIFSQIEIFETSDGAAAAFGPDWLPVYQEGEEGDPSPKWIKDGCDLGDACLMYYYETLDPTTELTILQYEIVFVDKNVIAKVMGRSPDYDMNPEYIQNLAQTLFDKVDAAPLAE
jgi:hypothetical protein